MSWLKKVPVPSIPSVITDAVAKVVDIGEARKVTANKYMEGIVKVTGDTDSVWFDVLVKLLANAKVTDYDKSEFVGRDKIVGYLKGAVAKPRPCNVKGAVIAPDCKEKEILTADFDLEITFKGFKLPLVPCTMVFVFPQGNFVELQNLTVRPNLDIEEAIKKLIPIQVPAIPAMPAMPTIPSNFPLW